MFLFGGSTFGILVPQQGNMPLSLEGSKVPGRAFLTWWWFSRSVISDFCHIWTVHGVFQARTLEWAAMLSSRGFSHPGTEPRSPALRADSLLSKPLGKPIEYPAAAAAKSLQSCLTLCDPIDGSPADSTIPGILQARTLEWAAISSQESEK